MILTAKMPPSGHFTKLPQATERRNDAVPVLAPLKIKLKAAFLVGLLLVGTAGDALAQCGNGPAGFDNWLQRFRLQAAAQAEYGRERSCRLCPASLMIRPSSASIGGSGPSS